MTDEQKETQVSRMNHSARALEDLSARLRQMADLDLADLERDLSLGWSGDSAQAYLERWELLREELRQSAQGLADSADTLRTAARLTQYPEEQKEEESK